jgi:undecaprenyl-diphosphatase
MQRITDIFKILSKRTWRQLVAAFVFFGVPVFVFVRLAEEVREKDTLAFDDSVLRAINSISQPWLDALVASVTVLGGVIGVLVLTAGLALLLWSRKAYRALAQVAVGVGGAVVLNALLKLAFQRDRPQLWERIVTENSYSFPSGHAMASSALALSLIVSLWPTKWRWIAVAVGLVYVLAIGFSRLYLGVHYPTDVLAGWAVSTAWVMIVTVVLTRRISLMSFLNKFAK